VSILKLLIHNLRVGSVTLPFPERPPIEGEYRGLVENQPEQCTGCALCAYVCTTGAVAVERDAEGFRWSYEPGQCTFCARCVQRCPKKALSMQSSRPPVYRRRGELNQSLFVKKKKPSLPTAAKSAAALNSSPQAAPNAACAIEGTV
jgi:formate hydrogenlyase subunit 6/NADH:ubiquinone oxidoreductase subunit I